MDSRSAAARLRAAREGGLLIASNLVCADTSFSTEDAGGSQRIVERRILASIDSSAALVCKSKSIQCAASPSEYSQMKVNAQPVYT